MRTRRVILTLLLALAAATALVACGNAKQKEVPADAIAVVGGQPITIATLDSLMAQAQAQYKTAKQSFPAVGSKGYQTLKDKAVAYLVQRSAVVQQATKMGIKVTDAQVNAKVAEVIKTNFKGDQAKFQAELKKQLLTEEQLKARIRENLIDDAAYAALIKNVTVSQGEIKNYYNEHKSSYKKGESRAVSHILLKTKAQADNVYQQLKAGADFTKLAKKYSIDTNTKASGGKLGALEKKSLVKSFADVLFGTLKTGSISTPVKTTYGWHIIMPTGPIVKSHLQTLSEASATIQPSLLATAQKKAVSDWVAKAEKFAAANTSYAAGYKPTTTTSSSTVATTTTQ
ncbi:MAG: peptidylprolyl isomerase [Gaiellaceae bacterium]